MTEDDICNRITKFKTKNKVIKINKNYSNIGKNIWKVLECKGIEPKEVDGVTTGDSELRFVSCSTHRSYLELYFYLQYFQMNIFRFKLPI